MEQRWWHWPIKIFMWIFSWIYTCTFWITFTIFGNLWWLLKIIIKGELKKTIDKKRLISKKVQSIQVLITEYTKFKYKFDGIVESNGILGKWPTWGALPIVSIYRGLVGNCEDSSFYFNFLKKSLIKNNNKYSEKVKSKIVIYMNYFLWEGISPHWFNIVEFTDADNVKNGIICFSSGYISTESKDSLAKRYLKGNEKYIWVK